MKIANMRVGVRIGAGFAMMLALMALVAVLGINRMGEIQDRLNRIVDVNNVEVNLAAAMRVSVNDRMIALRNIALLSEEADMQPEVERIREQEKLYAASKEKLVAMFSSLAGTTAGEKALMDIINTEEKAIQPLIAKAIQSGLANRMEEATAVLLKEVRPLQRKWVAALGDLIAVQTRLSEEASAQAQQAYAGARLLMIGLSLSAICFGSVMGWLVTRSITRPLNAAVKIARTVADGDLSARIEAHTTDETGQLLQALRDMNDNLARIVGQVRSGTETIATASGEIAAGNLDLSSRTEQQASSLEETASSMEELTSTVRKNADNAHQANGLAQSASDVALRGGGVVTQVIETMSSINGSARKIVDIIGVIDGIAFQTNILALNAAVEAARAGEQGRGFAVVASEVRNLAQRSAAAAKEIKSLIDDSVEKVDAGSKLVDQAGTTMREIVDSVGRVTAIMTDITAASREQSAGIEQVNQAIAEMDTVTQQNASLVEQAAAAAASMQEQSGQLLQLVSVFKVGDAADRTPARPAQRQAPVRAVPAWPAATAKPQRAVTEVARLGNVRKPTPVAGTRRANGADWVEF